MDVFYIGLAIGVFGVGLTGLVISWLQRGNRVANTAGHHRVTS
jgi:hypothetical protein